MSSFTVSASGDRGYNVSVSEQATNVGTRALIGDNVHIQIGGAGEVRLILPSGSRLERIKKDGRKDEYMRLVIPGGATVHISSGETLCPHVFVNAGKHITDHFADHDVQEVVHERVGDLIPVTED